LRSRRGAVGEILLSERDFVERVPLDDEYLRLLGFGPANRSACHLIGTRAQIVFTVPIKIHHRYALFFDPAAAAAPVRGGIWATRKHKSLR
jgi:hypothetical protein